MCFESNAIANIYSITFTFSNIENAASRRLYSIRQRQTINGIVMPSFSFANLPTIGKFIERKNYISNRFSYSDGATICLCVTNFLHTNKVIKQVVTDRWSPATDTLLAIGICFAKLSRFIYIHFYNLSIWMDMNIEIGSTSFISWQIYLQI